MKIKKVTITGADNDTDIREMVKISQQYPFVEWGILFSPKRLGEPRYPDYWWLSDLRTKRIEQKMNLSAHLCGGYTREMLMGKTDYLDNMPIKNFLAIFSRFQLNFNVSRTELDCDKFFPLLKKLGWNFILQHNNSNEMICNESIIRLQPISFLYDSSGGRGTIASEWKSPIGDFGHPPKIFFTGYAGGLSPENLAEELIKIEKVCNDLDANSEIWIDVESRVRTNGKLDMKKVKSFLEIASNHIA